MSDIRDLLHGMQSDAGMGADAPVELRARIQRVAGRRRATREVAGGSLAVVAAAALTWGVVRIGEGGQGEPATSSPSPSADESLSASPEPSASTNLIDESAFPWSAFAMPVLSPATQEAADAVLNPVPGPTQSIGVLEPASSFPDWEDADCAALTGVCGRIEAPPATRDVLDQVTPEWAIVADTVNAEWAPDTPLSAAYLASPNGDFYTLLDTSAVVDQLGVTMGELRDVALDPRAGTMVFVQAGEAGTASTAVYVDLATGRTTKLFTIDSWTTSVERDGGNYLMWGAQDDADPFAARLAPGAQSWDVADLWAVRDGLVERMAGNLVVRSDVGYELSPQPDLALANLTAPTTDGEQCEVARATADGILRYCQGGPAGAAIPAHVRWDGDVVDAPDAPALRDVPFTRSAVTLGDGILVAYTNVSEVNPLADPDAPLYEWHRPVGTSVIEGPPASGLHSTQVDGAAAWIQTETGAAVIDTEGTWRDLAGWAHDSDLMYANHVSFFDIG